MVTSEFDIESTTELDDFFDQHNSITPAVFTNMIMSLNGSYEINGISDELSSKLDRAMLSKLRSTADVILVGAETLRLEKYSSPVKTDGTPIPLAVLSYSGNLGEFKPGAGSKTLIFTSVQDESLDANYFCKPSWGMDEVISELKELGYQRILCEGGPSILAQLQQHQLINISYVTYSPIIARTKGRAESEATQAIALEYSATTPDGLVFTKWSHN